jgi:hypothetical protein
MDALKGRNQELETPPREREREREMLRSTIFVNIGLDYYWFITIKKKTMKSKTS